MSEQRRAPERAVCLSKLGSAVVMLWLCLVLCMPNPTFAISNLDQLGCRHSSFLGEKATAVTPTVDNAAHSTNSPCGGTANWSGRFPYLCSLRHPGTRKHGCTATLVGNRWLLTAAHCLDPNYNNSVGCYPVAYCGIMQLDTTSRSETYHVEEVYVHDRWRGDPSAGYDIAMLKLEKGVKLNPPRLIRRGTVDLENTDVVTPGWRQGEDDYGMCGVQSYIPLSWEEKSNHADKTGKLPRNSWFCCGADKDTNLGTDGGPLVLPDRQYCEVDQGDPTEDIIIGIVSNEFDKKNSKFFVYSSIVFYRDWILKTMKGKTEPHCTFESKCDSSQGQCGKASKGGAGGGGSDSTSDAPTTTSDATTTSPVPSLASSPVPSLASSPVPSLPSSPVPSSPDTAETAIQYEDIFAAIEKDDAAKVNQLLMKAAQQGDVDFIKIFGKSADLSAIDEEGRTALHEAVAHCKVDTVDAFVRMRGKLSPQERDQLVEIICSKIEGHKETKQKIENILRSDTFSSAIV